MANENTFKIIDIENAIMDFKQGHISETTLLVEIQSVLDGGEGSNVYFDDNGEAFTRGVAHLVHGQIPVRRYKL